MLRIVEFAGRAQRVSGNLLGLPKWARVVLVIAALPGLLALSLSLAAVLVSLSALLLLTVPTFRILRAVTSERQNEAGDGIPGEAFAPPPDVGSGSAVNPLTGRRQVEVKIIPTPGGPDGPTNIDPPPGRINESDYG